MPAFLDTGTRVLHYALSPGTDAARPIVFANSLGTDFRIWDGVLARLPDGTPTLRYDKSGHGLSQLGAVSIADHAVDLAALMDALGLRDALICGVSVGGLIAQQLAATRPDLVTGLLLSNTGFKIGDDATWNARIATLDKGGLGPMADAILERWFSPDFHTTRAAELEGYRAMLTRTPQAGYRATCEAIRDVDLGASTAQLTCPALCLAGGSDLATPPEVVQALAARLPGAQYHCLKGIGHLPCIEAPEAVARLLTDLSAGLP
ncbi:3-oxoadipate enol-lactonase [Pseudoruegeria sp. SHC-113]|uniref:3-oxoadipate enol-lactonase n=1 Tax=Pseudoruegeria sp. SHC-113 TaxID=2855439 RepID=UPI0021BB455A|nr:3-oxoadipate enol-lactonase [Pseudoruegeria sp. SHC-113]MCT8162137.1 3-oxoadipate enol-lactonase [Pseudoruegeria sp. SHC-113]